MKVAIFSTKSYDQTFLDAANTGQGHELIFFEPHRSDVMRYSIAVLFFLFLTKQSAGIEVPQLTGWVTDKAGVLNADQLRDLDRRLHTYEDTTSSRFAILIVPSLDGASIEEYSLEVATKNQMSKKDKNNALLLLVAIQDRKIRFEVGYGLEPTLTDALTSSIINEVVKPHFKRGEYYEGILAGMEAAMLAAKGEFTVEKKPNGGSASPIFFIVFILIFILLVARGAKRSGRWGGGSGIYFGGGGSGWSSGSGGSSGGSSWSGGGFSSGGSSFGGGGSSGSW